MAYTTINKSTDYFNTKLYTGTGYSLNVTGVGHQPDFTWIKCSAAGSGTDHVLFDTVRGVTKALNSNDNSVEDPISNALTAFGTDGFTVNGNGATGANGDTYVSWNWKAGTTSGLSGGTITPSAYSINTTSGFSIIKWTGTSSAGTIPHGLGVKPEMIIIKRLTAYAENWVVYHKGLNNGTNPEVKYLELNTTNAQLDSSSTFNDQPVTNTVFNVKDDGTTNSNASDYIAYCFAGKTGYSKFGSYTGNGNADGTFVYTGFKPTFIMIKRWSGGANNWTILDDKRDPTNQMDKGLFPNLNNLQTTGYNCDFLSNGFKWRLSGSGENGTDFGYIYMAFGQSLVGSNNVPCTAR